MATRYASTTTKDYGLSSSHLTNVRSNITTISDDAYKATQTIVNYARNVTDSLLDLLSDMTLSEMCDFNTRNFQFMQRLMYLNANEIKITLNSLGTNALVNGDSTQITNQLQAPSYVDDRNYVENYVKYVTATENQGINTTRAISSSASTGANTNYTNINQLYKTTENLFPDELEAVGGKSGSGLFTTAQKWNLNDSLDSTLRKTKDLFNRKKINTIISAFHTDTSTPEVIGDARSAYGLSHGRNLLTKEAEISKGGNYPTNGYDNPYCRVWTHHHQYNRLDRLIRPFYVASDSERQNTSVISLQKFHQWPNFKVEGNEWGWKSSQNDGWQYSVLNDNGFVNIAPKYLGGGKKNIHPKQCMFSIENLAWQGFDPYSFEQALSWEQRGPMGGRIMWFPPYGLSFSEATTANWQNHTFIGRGEDVYTYTNTIRRGTLNFMLVVDHPSIVDYVTWDDQDHSKTADTDLLRFFAGCEAETNDDADERSDENNDRRGWGAIRSNTASLRDRATPTPLTDEYTTSTAPKLDAAPQTTEPEETPSETIKYTFYVFYPNNYAGHYDPPIGSSESESKNNTGVEAMAYLLAGKGAQKNTNDTSAHPADVPISFDGLSSSDFWGYEMSLDSNGQPYKGDTFPVRDLGVTRDTEQNSGAPTGESHNYIQGNASHWDQCSAWKDSTNPNQRWFYRIDGRYQYEKRTEDRNTNCYDQRLIDKPTNKDKVQSYYDLYTNGLNASYKEVEKANLGTIGENETLVSLAEVAYVLATKNAAKEKISINAGERLSDEHVSALRNIFYGPDVTEEDTNSPVYKLSSVTITGYANSHGSNPDKLTNDSRNIILAKNRAYTIRDWLTNYFPSYVSKNGGVEFSITNDIDVTKSENKNIVKQFVISVATGDESDLEAKKWRSAKVELCCDLSTTTTVADSNQSETYTDTTTGETYTSATSYVSNTGFAVSRVVDGVTYYKNPNETDPDKRDVEWIYDDVSQSFVMVGNQDLLDRSNYGKFRENKGWNTDNLNGVYAVSGVSRYNRLRYDQEYHFFKELEAKHPAVFASLTDKLKYFSPAFHSGTPEGLSARLTFLAQCLRQGPTIGASSYKSRTANNLAFGRPPVCVLRIGDFFNTKIVIDNMSVTYDTIHWDLNTEGIGVQPMIANVSISFTFIGGSDVRGAVARLQNAVSFNYYANTSLFDNRADRPSYNYSQMTAGALDHEINKNSYFYNVATQK